jgi:hypothetical protein
MNYGRLLMAAVAATIVDGIYGFIVYGTLLMSQFAQYPGVFRPADAQMAFMPYLFVGIFIAMVAAAYIYAKGYEGGSGVAEGARFGVLMGIFVATAFAGVNYATLNIGRRHSLVMAAAAFVEWTLIGIVIGLVYKPSAAGARRTVRV